MSPQSLHDSQQLHIIIFNTSLCQSGVHQRRESVRSRAVRKQRENRRCALTLRPPDFPYTNSLYKLIGLAQLLVLRFVLG